LSLNRDEAPPKHQLKQKQNHFKMNLHIFPQVLPWIFLELYPLKMSSVIPRATTMAPRATNVPVKSVKMDELEEDDEVAPPYVVEAVVVEVEVPGSL